MKKVALELDEWLIETDVEQEEVTRFYCRELRRMKAAKGRGGGKVQIVVKDEEFDDGDDEEDELENAFLDNAMTGKKDSKRVDKILK